MPSNSSRLLHRFGLRPYLKDKAVESPGINIFRWQDGSKIGYTKLVPEFKEDFGAEYYVIHRAHFLDALYTRAVELGVEVRFGARVVDYDIDHDSAQAVTSAGEKFGGDLIVAADGELLEFARSVDP